MSKPVPIPPDAYLAAIIESSDDAIVSKDLHGIVTSWNAAAERLFGYTSDEMVGQSITKIIPRARLDEEAYVLSRIRNGLRVDHFETVRQHKDGHFIDISLTISPIRDENGTIVGASKVARDITDQKRRIAAEQRAKEQEEAHKRQLLEAENQRIQEASRLKNQFVANMSHELRTPLNSIMGFAELIVDARVGPIEPKYQRFGKTILKSAQHLLQLINDILDLAKIESGKIESNPERVELPGLVNEVASIMTTLAKERDIRIDIDVNRAVEVLNVDPNRLKQVLYNYLSNAIKFSRPGGRVSVRVKPEGEDRFRIEVQDWGIGIRSEDVARLFIEFEQLDATSTKTYKGTGLGLALTKRIVEAQGGTVGVQSTFGSGTTFVAILPRDISARSIDVTSGEDPHHSQPEFDPLSIRR